MKLLYTTDLHFNKEWFKWVEKQQDSYDAFCITGDFLDSSKDESLSQQIEWVTNWIKNFKKPLFVCSGNHDIEEFENEEWLNSINTSNYYPDNSIITLNGLKFGCYPYLGADGYYEFDECDILLTHTPPANTKTAIDKSSKKDWGDKELYSAIKNGIISPRVVLCGHIHQPLANVDTLKNTTVYNVGLSDDLKILILDHKMQLLPNPYHS